MNLDGEAAMRCWAATVQVGPWQYRIAPRPAADWWPVLAAEDWLAIVPGWCEGAGDEVDDALLDGSLSAADLLAAARDAATEMAGCPWWSAARLLRAAIGEPAAMGELALRGADLDTMPLGALVQALYRLYTRGADKNQRARLDAELDKPPQGAAELVDDDAMGDQWERFAAARSRSR